GKLSTYEIENKKLKREIENYSQLSQKLKEAEKENKDLSNGIAVQKKTLATLQQDLVSEKLRTQKYADEFAKVVETINKLCLENGLADVRINKSDICPLSDHFSQPIGDCFQSLLERCLIQKDSQIEQLQASL